MSLEQKYNQECKKQAESLIRLANSLFTVTTETTLDPYDIPELTELNEHKKSLDRDDEHYPQYKGIDCGESLRKFSIPFKYMPDDIIDFMVSIEWVNCDTMIPNNKYGFYSSTYHLYGTNDINCKYCTITEWYIDVSRYFDLLLIMDNIKRKFTKNVA